MLALSEAFGRRKWNKELDVILAINRQGTTILMVEPNAVLALQIAHCG